MNPSPHIVTPTWPVPNNRRAYSTLRGNGFNFGLAGNHNHDQVIANRKQLSHHLQCPKAPHWLTQSHSTTHIAIDKHSDLFEGDATSTRSSHTVCAILTGDCLPILLCNQQGTEVAAIHAGWRGLLDGVIQSTVRELNCHPNELMAWLGPCIGPVAFKLNADIRQQFINNHPAWAEGFVSHDDSWHGDLHALANIMLNHLGINQTYQDNRCTYQHPDLFYSYRRDGQSSGRMAHLIWIDE